jgi:hypothetical protein
MTGFRTANTEPVELDSAFWHLLPSDDLFTDPFAGAERLRGVRKQNVNPIPAWVECSTDAWGFHLNRL